jgi:hypothetical protein
MYRLVLSALLAVVLTLGLAGSASAQKFRHGGAPPSGGGAAFACDLNLTGVCADFANGQTFVQWPDAASGAAGANFRYRVYRSTSPITAGNYTSATKIASYVLNNSGQLIGGDPDNGGSLFTQTNRQAATGQLQVDNPMSQIPDAQAGGGVLKPLSYYTGLQVYKALAAGNAYYAVVSTNTSDASPAYIGSVGPIAESVAPQQALQIAHRTTGSGHITSPTAGLPIVFSAHASSAFGGCATNCTLGDYYEWFGDITEGWQDGNARVFDVAKDGVGFINYPTFTPTGGALIYGNRDTQWTTDGLSGIETYHYGMGFTPNPLVGVANRFYPITFNGIKKQIAWIAANYGADLNQVHWGGGSMGADGGALSGLHMRSVSDPAKPMFASIMVSHPYFHFDLSGTGLNTPPFGGPGHWPGKLWGGSLVSPWPFSATVANAPATLGSNPAVILFGDGTPWETYADGPGYIASSPGRDLPWFGWMMSKDDVQLAAAGPASFAQEIAASDAFEAAHRGHAFVWFMGQHETGFPGFGSINCDWGNGTNAITAGCYQRPWFRLDRAYLAFDHSSINDDPGTATRTANGTYDGDVVGGRNIGFKWTISTDTSNALNFVVSNTWMGLNPTNIPSTTIVGSIAPSGTGGTFSLANATGFLPSSSSVGNYYYLIGGTEVITGTKTAGSSVITIVGRGLLVPVLGSTTQAHSNGESIIQYTSQATGPKNGPFSTMTVNVTPRRLQGFIKPPGTVVNCTYTGGSGPASTTIDPDGLLTLIGVTINLGVSTGISCV